MVLKNPMFEKSLKEELQIKFDTYVEALSSGNNKNPYSGYDLDYLISSISKVSSRLIEMRSQYEQLDAQNITMGKKYSLLKKTVPGDRELDRASLNKKNAEVECKWKSVELHNKYMEALHEYDGSSLNYSQRAGRLRIMIFEEMNTFFHKAYSLHLGMKHIYKIIPVENFTEIPEYFTEASEYKNKAVDLIDCFVFWIRKIIFLYEEQLAGHDRFEVSYSLMQTRKLSNNPKTKASMLSINKLTKLLEGRKIELDLSSQFPEDLFENVRVKGVNVSVALWPTRRNKFGRHANPGVQYCSIRSLLFPPAQSNLFSKEIDNELPEPQPQSPLFLDQVTLPEPGGETSYIRTKRTENLDPAGKWTLIISSFIFGSDYSYHNPHHRKSFKNMKKTQKVPWISDIKLHLKLEAKYRTKEQGKWLNYHEKIDLRDKLT